MRVDTAESPTVSRRRIGATTAGLAIGSSSIVSVARGATDSGNVEVETVATVPTNTSISLTINEDTDADSQAENTASFAVADGTNTTVLNGLVGGENTGKVYWAEVSMSTSDDTVTPELDRVTITLPEDPPPSGTPVPSTPVGPKDKKDPGQIWESFSVFVGFIILVFAAIGGMGSRSMAIGATCAYSVFAYIAITTGHTLLTNILYVTLVLVIVGMAFKMWRAEIGGEV